MNTAALASCLLLAAAPLAAGDSFRLAEKGRALLPVVVSPDASPRTREVAAELASYLARIAGADFQVKTGDGSQGDRAGNEGGVRMRRRGAGDSRRLQYEAYEV